MPICTVKYITIQVNSFYAYYLYKFVNNIEIIISLCVVQIDSKVSCIIDESSNCTIYYNNIFRNVLYT